MHRQHLLQICEQYKNRYPDERDFVDEFIAHIERTPNCFDRVRGDGAIDIAACTLLLSAERLSVLCQDHALIKKWTQPGGHADGESNLHTVAREEVAEEVGLTDISFVSEIPFHIHRFDYDASVFGYPKSIYSLYFSATFPEDQTPRIMEPDKCHALRWFDHAGFVDYVRDDGDPYGINQVFVDKWDAITGQ